MTNLKARFRPFLILQPRAGIRVMPGVDYPKGGTHYLWWNHWPVAQIPSDGTEAHAPDKPSHTSLVQSIEHSPVIIHERGRRDFSDARNTGIFFDKEKSTFSAVHLTGMTDKPISGLQALARSWDFSVDLKLNTDKFVSEGYDKVQRAYLLTCVVPGKPSVLEMDLRANPHFPLVNPVFVINSWGEANARLMVDGKEIKRGKEFRIGHRNRPEGSDLIVWLNLNAAKPVAITLIPE